MCPPLIPGVRMHAAGRWRVSDCVHRRRWHGYGRASTASDDAAAASQRAHGVLPWRELLGSRHATGGPEHHLPQGPGALGPHAPRSSGTPVNPILTHMHVAVPLQTIPCRICRPQPERMSVVVSCRESDVNGLPPMTIVDAYCDVATARELEVAARAAAQKVCARRLPRGPRPWSSPAHAAATCVRESGRRR